MAHRSGEPHGNARAGGKAEPHLTGSCDPYRRSGRWVSDEAAEREGDDARRKRAPEGGAEVGPVEGERDRRAGRRPLRSAAVLRLLDGR